MQWSIRLAIKYFINESCLLSYISIESESVSVELLCWKELRYGCEGTDCQQGGGEEDHHRLPSDDQGNTHGNKYIQFLLVITNK